MDMEFVVSSFGENNGWRTEKIFLIGEAEWTKMKNGEKTVGFAKKFPYKISNFGRVKRIGSGQGARVGLILKSGMNGSGYLFVVLTQNGVQKIFRISRLVIEAFVGLRPKGKEINHIDGNKQNDYVNNLEYVTRSENMKHAYKIGLAKKKNHSGEKNPNSKLKTSNILEIRKLYKMRKMDKKELAKKFKVAVPTIETIIYRQKWKHI